MPTEKAIQELFNLIVAFYTQDSEGNQSTSASPAECLKLAEVILSAGYCKQNTPPTPEERKKRNAEVIDILEKYNADPEPCPDLDIPDRHDEIRNAVLEEAIEEIRKQESNIIESIHSDELLNADDIVAILKSLSQFVDFALQ